MFADFCVIYAPIMADIIFQHDATTTELKRANNYWFLWASMCWLYHSTEEKKWWTTINKKSKTSVKSKYLLMPKAKAIHKNLELKFEMITLWERSWGNSETEEIIDSMIKSLPSSEKGSRSSLILDIYRII